MTSLVLTSSVTRQYPDPGETVFDTNLAAITVPVLVVADQDDACPVTPPGDAPRIAAFLVRSPRKEVVYVHRDQICSSCRACEAFAPHGFFGIESAVIQHIADWIRATPAKAHGEIETRSVDVPGLALPTWEDVVERDYEPWDRSRIVLDTAGCTIVEALNELRRRIRDTRSGA